ncbi:MAG TPA: hypothetical protein VKU39_18900 [Streptosporangiaceae bacterium]|nr:hypothetical protein [Streptosporangiaceae bacterium]
MTHDEHGCEHKQEDTCPAAASFTVSAGRQHDQRYSCKRHLALTVLALAADGGVFGEDAPRWVTVTPLEIRREGAGVVSEGPLTEQEALDDLRAAFRRMSPEQLAGERSMLDRDISRSRGRDPYMAVQLAALDQEIGRREAGTTAST